MQLLLKYRWTALFFYLALCSCSTHKVITDEKFQGLKNSYCVPSMTYKYITLPPIDDSQLHFPFLRALSEHDWRMSQATGITSLLMDALQTERDTGLVARLHKSDLRQSISQQLALVSLQIQAVSAELDCEGERVDEVATYLDKLNSKRNNGLIIASVILGALTTGAAALVADNNLNKGVALSGGLISAGLGALTINYTGKRIEFLHPRNLLHDIWADSLIGDHYPPSIWYVLHEKIFSNSGQTTLVNNLKNRWLQFELGGKTNRTQERLLFGPGGIYTSQDLHTRSALINQLQATIRSVQQDLSSLALSVNRFF